MKHPLMVLIFRQFKQLCSVLNQWIWPSPHEIDRSTQTFFTFKAFPQQLKTTETEKWAQLQAKTSSPFSQGDQYLFISQKGVHIWYSVTPFLGLPETAAQTPLEDGEHLILGEKFLYNQIWKDGVLLSCAIQSNTKQDDMTRHINSQKYWAIKGQLEEKLSSPLTWIFICLFVLVSQLIWFGTGLSTLLVKQVQIEQKNNQLSNNWAEKLQIQTKLREKQENIETLQGWHSENGYFPEFFALISQQLSQQGKWEVSHVTWQNKTIELEFSSKQIDIRTLIVDLEKLSVLTQVNIKPHNSNDVWILEATSI